MSRPPPPCLDAAALQRAYGRSRQSRTQTREGRIALLGEVGEALLAGRLPSREAALFLGSALMAWLAHGGNFERDFLEVRKPKSHNTVARVWAQLRAEAEAAHGNDGEQSADGAG